MASKSKTVAPDKGTPPATQKEQPAMKMAKPARAGNTERTERTTKHGVKIVSYVAREAK
jgi:hypothetical protein